MARRPKTSLSYITNDAKRKESYKKRKKGLLNKTMELSTLCGVEACAIIHSPYDHGPQVWPDNIQGVQNVIARFKALPEMEQTRRRLNQETFTRERIYKGELQLAKLRREKERKEMLIAMHDCFTKMKSLDCLSSEDRNKMLLTVKQTVREIDARNEALRSQRVAPQPDGNNLVVNHPVDDQTLNQLDHTSEDNHGVTWEDLVTELYEADIILELK